MTDFRFLETSGSLWDRVLASGRPSRGSWRLDLASGSLWNGVLASGSPLGGSWRLDLGSGRLDLGSGGQGTLDLWSGGQGTLDLGSGRLDLGSETLLGPLFGGFLRVFLWDGDQI